MKLAINLWYTVLPVPWSRAGSDESRGWTHAVSRRAYRRMVAVALACQQLEIVQEYAEIQDLW
jgi:hypothetical protein